MLTRLQLLAARSLHNFNRVNPPGINSLRSMFNGLFISSHPPHLAIRQQQYMANLLPA
jgi:hypothetical protein